MKMNVVFVFGDQHRAQSTGYAGNPDLKTPNLDRLARESISFTRAVSGHPVCSPYRASFITGQYPQTHGVFVNDVCLGNRAVSIAEAFSSAGYNTAYIGKWHLDGHGRSSFIPRERRQGFDFWRVLECTHDYNNSYYYGDEDKKLLWKGYDVEAQTACACEYIKSRDRSKPFFLVLSWGPPHNPYQTAPQRYKDMYKPEELTLRPNVPEECEERARKDLAGYYAHISAMDSCIGDLLETIRQEGLNENTIFVYTSDHGDMIESHGLRRKQKPWDESILVPFLLRNPRYPERNGIEIDTPINAPDIMPTLLDLCGIDIPGTVEGISYAPLIEGKGQVDVEAVLLQCIHPFGEWHRGNGGKEYRGIRTKRYTYVRDLNGPWLLYDNEKDPYQLNNLCNLPEQAELQSRLDSILNDMLAKRGDRFLKGEEYIRQWGYVTDETGTVPYTG